MIVFLLASVSGTVPAANPAAPDTTNQNAAPILPDNRANPTLVKLPFAFPEPCMETTPVIYEGRPLLVNNYRTPRSTADEMHLCILDLRTGKEITRFGQSYSFVSGFVQGQQMNVFAAEYGPTEKDWTKSIYRFSSMDLKNWKREQVIPLDDQQHFFNTSVCRDDQGYLIAYESNVPVQWCFRFARSKDLVHWEKIGGMQFADLEEKTACGNPTIRYFAPYYYLIYGAWRWKGPGTTYEYDSPKTQYITLIARSQDLITWELSPTRHPMLEPALGEGINNTDADLFEYEGNTYVYYATGDQATWGTVRIAMYAGPMKQLFERYFPPNTPRVKFDTQKGQYTYPAQHGGAEKRPQAAGSTVSPDSNGSMKNFVSHPARGAIRRRIPRLTSWLLPQQHGEE